MEIFRLSIEGTEFQVFEEDDGQIYLLHEESESPVGPFDVHDVLDVAARCFGEESSLMHTHIYATSDSWGEGAVANAVIQSFARHTGYQAEMYVDGILWTSAGDGSCYPTDIADSSAVVDSIYWELPEGGGSPGNADDGTYYLVYYGKYFAVILQSGGEIMIDEKFMADNISSAIGKFRERWGD